MTRAKAFNDQAVTSMNALYERYYKDIRYRGRTSMDLALPVRPKAFATAIKRHAKSQAISGRVIFYYGPCYELQGWEYVPTLSRLLGSAPA